MAKSSLQSIGLQLGKQVLNVPSKPTKSVKSMKVRSVSRRTSIVSTEASQAYWGHPRPQGGTSPESSLTGNHQSHRTQTQYTKNCWWFIALQATPRICTFENGNKQWKNCKDIKLPNIGLCEFVSYVKAKIKNITCTVKKTILNSGDCGEILTLCVWNWNNRRTYFSKYWKKYSYNRYPKQRLWGNGSPLLVVKDWWQLYSVYFRCWYYKNSDLSNTVFLYIIKLHCSCLMRNKGLKLVDIKS